ncbi:MAG: pyridoxal phosphate-dependent aminotransferase [Polyangiaceae bacterium]|nr:pyridoxal phosphate-dependent aminotransferase [Polyangiaceae bacterium]
MPPPQVPLSRRTAWLAEPNPLALAAEAARRGPTPPLDLTTSNPLEVGLLPPADLRALAGSGAQAYQPDPLGLGSARRAVADYYRERHGTQVDPARVLLTSSTSEAYAYLFWALADPGDEILVPTPSYPLFAYLADLTGLRLTPYPLAYDGTWHVDLPALAAAAGPSTRAVLIVSPNNPTGSFLKKDELSALRAFAAEHRLALVSDEVFLDYGLAPDATRAGTLAAEAEGLSFALGGLSKAAALPQLKLAWTVIAGAAAEAEAALERLSFVADTFLSPGSPVQCALPSLLAQAPARSAAIRGRAARNLAALVRAFEGSAATPLRTEGGWSAVVRMPATRSADEWAAALLAAGVLVQPGYFYDFVDEARLVVSLLPSPEVYDEALTRWRALLDEGAGA